MAATRNIARGRRPRATSCARASRTFRVSPVQPRYAWASGLSSSARQTRPSLVCFYTAACTAFGHLDGRGFHIWRRSIRSCPARPPGNRGSVCPGVRNGSAQGQAAEARSRPPEAARGRAGRGRKRKPGRKGPVSRGELAERTGLEPATPGVTGRYSNQLNYRSTGRGAHPSRHGDRCPRRGAKLSPAAGPVAPARGTPSRRAERCSP